MGDLINGRTPEEIKTALKVCPEDIKDCPACPYALSFTCRDNVMLDALTLIERLESERDAEMAKMTKWISVKERLPENEKCVIIAGWREGISGKLWPVVMTAFHTDGKMLAQDSDYAWSNGNIEMKYDEDADDFIVPEGWFEDVQCADEFSTVDAISVTHWMPLPQLPEEKDA